MLISPCICMLMARVYVFVGSEPTGVKCGDLYMSFKSIFQDCRDAVDWVHYKVKALSDTIRLVISHVP